MLSLPFFCLICALASGVMGFGPEGLPVWTLGKPLFAVFLLLAISLFLRSELQRPSLMWAVVDDYRERRRRRTVRRQRVRVSDAHAFSPRLSAMSLPTVRDR